MYFTNTATLFFNNRYLTFSRDDNYTFGGNIVGAVTDDASAVFNQGSVIQEGAGTLTLTGNNTYVGGTTISNGMVMMGAGGTSGTLGSGTVTIQTANSWLVFNRADNVTFSNQISGLGGIMQIGSGTLTLAPHELYICRRDDGQQRHTAGHQWRVSAPAMSRPPTDVQCHSAARWSRAAYGSVGHYQRGDRSEHNQAERFTSR